MSYKDEQMRNIALVKEIQKRPFIYDYTNINYMRKDVTEEGWSDIAKAVGMNPIRAKERWRSIRTVFARHLKAVNSAKPYYLAESMQFSIPYLKKRVYCNTKETGANVQDIEQEDNDSYDDQSYNNVDLPFGPEETETLTSQQMDVEVKFENDPYPIEDYQIRRNSPQSAPSNSGFGNISTSKSSRREVSECFDEYLAAKKAKLETQTDLEDDPRKMFLLSLLPDLNEMTEAQMRTFKLKTLCLVSDILQDQPPAPKDVEDKEPTTNQKIDGGATLQRLHCG